MNRRQIYKIFFTYGFFIKKIQKIIIKTMSNVGQSHANPFFLLCTVRGWEGSSWVSSFRLCDTTCVEAALELSTARLSTARRRTRVVVSLAVYTHSVSTTVRVWSHDTTRVNVSCRSSRLSTLLVVVRLIILQAVNDDTIGIDAASRSHVDSRFQSDKTIIVSLDFVSYRFNNVLGVDLQRILHVAGFGLFDCPIEVGAELRDLCRMSLVVLAAVVARQQPSPSGKRGNNFGYY